MKKVTTLIALVLVTILLTACSKEEEPFTLSNFTILSTTTEYNDKIQYDSVYNLDTTNTTLFSNLKDTISEYEVNMINDMDNITPKENQVVINIITNNGNLEIFMSTIKVDGENTDVAVIVFNNDSGAHGDIELYNKLKALYE